MTWLDRWLQCRRIDQARPYIRFGTRVLDIGSAEGALFIRLRARIGEGVGVDPALDRPVEGPGYRLLPGRFPDGLEGAQPFDAITMLAVLEHIPEGALAAVSRSCAELLKPGGRLIITVPSPQVDRLLHWLMRWGFVDGMSAHEHHGFDVRMTPALFSREGFRLVVARRFQLGLNNLFVFEKPSGVPALAEARS